MELKQDVARLYKNAGQLKQDVDLAPLRSREDIQELLAELGVRKEQPQK